MWTETVVSPEMFEQLMRDDRPTRISALERASARWRGVFQGAEALSALVLRSEG